MSKKFFIRENLKWKEVKKMKKIMFILLMALFVALPAYADISFVNGGFDDAGGNLDGWTINGSGPGAVSLSGNGISTYSGGAGGVVAATVAPGIDPNVGINTTFAGSYSGRVGDATPWWGSPYQYNSITQAATITGATAGHLYFAWAAVLETSGHSYADTPYFQVKIHNDTQGGDIYDVKKYEQDGGFWTTSGWWQYSTGNDPLYPGWYVEDLDLTALGVNVGDTLTLTALARDCNPTGHAMYVYLDGFGGTYTTHDAPEPATLLLLGSGLIGLGFARKRFKK